MRNIRHLTYGYEMKCAPLISIGNLVISRPRTAMKNDECLINININEQFNQLVAQGQIAWGNVSLSFACLTLAL